MSCGIKETPPTSVKEPFDMMRFSIDEIIVVKMQNGRKLRGRLHAYDPHLNMVLGDVEETITDIDIDVETLEEIHSETKRVIPLVFLRGENVILISPCEENEFFSYEVMLN